MKYKVDVVRIRENSITLNGWALGKTPESKVTFRVEDEHHQPVKCKMVSTRRDDVSQIYFKKVIDKEFGFDIQFPYERGKSYWLLIRCDGRQAKIKYNEELITKRASVAHKRMEKIKDLMNMETVHVALDFWKENGLRALIKKSCHKIQGLDNDYDYGEWYELTKPTEEELKAQRETHFEKEPLFSVVIPVYKTPERYLKEMLDSILDQTYGNWEVCIADGSPRGQDVEKVLKKYAQKDSRIRYEILGGNRGISGNTNAALAMVQCDPETMMIPDSAPGIYEVAKAINKHPDCDVLYSDEDKLIWMERRLDPHFADEFRPAYSELYLPFVRSEKRVIRPGRRLPPGNFDGTRIMTLSSVALSRQKRSSISHRYFITGAAIRTLLPAIRKARCMLLRLVPERSWPIMSVWASRQNVWKRA